MSGDGSGSGVRRAVKGTELWARAEETARRALGSGALLPIATRLERVEDGGVPFVVRMVDSLARKHEERAAVLQGRTVKPSNPFLPYDPELWVADVNPSHVCLLNKYNVLDEHLLVVTRAFEAQEWLLTREDFEALWRCMVGKDALAFYNGGRVAGASQGHKHLQLVPRSAVSGGGVLPVEAVMPEAAPGRIMEVPALAFPHAWVGLEEAAEEPEAVSERLRERYLGLLRRVGAASSGAEREQAGAYNLLLTRRWMLAVPRTVEFFQGMSINALGFAGCLLVRNEQQLAAVRAAGPMRMLHEASAQQRMVG